MYPHKSRGKSNTKCSSAITQTDSPVVGPDVKSNDLQVQLCMLYMVRNVLAAIKYCYTHTRHIHYGIKGVCSNTSHVSHMQASNCLVLHNTLPLPLNRPSHSPPPPPQTPPHTCFPSPGTPQHTSYLFDRPLISLSLSTPSSLSLSTQYLTGTGSCKVM